MGGLAWETKSETLRRYFEQFGEILEAVVIADKKAGRWKGYRFVSIAHLSASCGFFGRMEILRRDLTCQCFSLLWPTSTLDVTMFICLEELGNFSRSGICKKSMCRPKPSNRWQTGKL